MKATIIEIFLFVQPEVSLTGSVAAGAELAIKECGEQFRSEVWNCPVTAFRSRRQERDNNRESAFIQAITTAAVTHTITRNCSQGSIAVSIIRLTGDSFISTLSSTASARLGEAGGLRLTGSGEAAVTMSSTGRQSLNSSWTLPRLVLTPAVWQTSITARLGGLLSGRP